MNSANNSGPTCSTDDARRRLLSGAWGCALLAAAARTAAAAVSADETRSTHFPFGPVVPARALAAWPVKTHEGRAADLPALLRGRVTALQLMFTGCSATCPIQGALFAQAQQELRLAPGVAQFVSLSIDPLADDPAALSAWLRKFSARAGWLAAAPRIDDVDAIVALLGSGGQPVANRARDPHTGQVYLIDRQGALVYRLPSMPTPSDINAALAAVAQRF
jgi:protein SCO1/2